MNFYLENFLYFVFGFIIIFLLYLFVYKYNKKKRKKTDNITINLLIKRYNLDLTKHSYKKLYIITSLINSFIIAFTFMIIINFENFFYKIMIGFALIFILIYSLYEIIGKLLKKSEFKVKKVKEVKNKTKKKGKKK